MISREEMLNIANLSKLHLDEEELEIASKEMGGIINFVNQINSLQSGAKEISDINGLSNALREDEVVPPYPRDEILKNVDGGKDGFFYIKKFA
jgi:aspartyl-tRNA(Asn)/glutamyl-tRNA(Gln) amidotransferase subunit C